MSSVIVVFAALTCAGVGATGSSKAGTVSSEGSRCCQTLLVSVCVLMISIYLSQSAGLLRMTETFYGIDIIEVNLML